MGNRPDGAWVLNIEEEKKTPYILFGSLYLSKTHPNTNYISKTLHVASLFFISNSFKKLLIV